MQEIVGLIEFITITKTGGVYMLNGTITHSVVFDKTNTEISSYVRDSLRVFYKRNIFIDQLATNPKSNTMSDTEDDCLHTASNQGFDYLILTWEGNIFNIYLFHEECLKFINDLDKRTNGNWLVAGQIIDQYQNRIMYDDSTADLWKNSFWLYPITAIVNLKKWRELGKPSWGKEGFEEVIQAIASEQCVHDNYTPLEISSTQTYVKAKVKKGWNIINCSLKNNIPVHNLSEEIRSSQTHLYPEVDPVKYNNFWTHLFDLPKLPDNYKKVFQSLITSKFPDRIDPKTWQCFIRNTEDYFPIRKSENVLEWSSVESLITPCSGFKDFIVAMSNQSDCHPVQIVHYDILPECVNIKRRITQEWDGTRIGFTSLLNAISSDYAKVGKGNCFHMNSMETYDEAYQDILKYFSDEAQITERWKQFQTFDHQWIHADMLDQDGAISVKKLIKGKLVYLCLSDIASWRGNILSYGYKNLRNDIQNSISILLKNHITGMIDYKDPGTDRQLLQNFDQAISHLNLPLDYAN
jgi:hypothetical protein